MAAAVRRAPLGEVSQSRMRGLISQKNTQNAVTEKLLYAAREKSYEKSYEPSYIKPYMAPLEPSVTLKAPTKRVYEPEIFEDDSDFDTENIDPSVFSAKRSKSNDGGAAKTVLPRVLLKPSIGKTPAISPKSAAISSMENLLKGIVTPPAFEFPGGARTAPAGRSPPHKRSGLLSARRIDPPNFSKGSSLPFSIEDALRGTSALVNKEHQARKSISEKLKQPKEWFFDIYEDTPDEVAANVMEHSACRLDLSSDDEVDTAGKKKDDRGKENVPPPDYVPTGIVGNTPVASGSLSDTETKTKVKNIHRGRKGVGAMAVDRVALGSLPVADFYGEGISASDVFHVPADEDVVAVGTLAAEVAAAKAKTTAFVIATDDAEEIL